NSIAVAVNGENGPIAAINITWPARRAVVEEVALRHLSSLQGIAARIGALVDGSSFARGPPDDEAGSEGRQGALSGDGMKAWILRKGATSLDAMQLVEQDAPVAGAGEVLIRVRACSLNYRDQMIPLGLYMGGPVTQDIVPLSDGAGEIGIRQHGAELLAKTEARAAHAGLVQPGEIGVIRLREHQRIGAAAIVRAHRGKAV
ncbi:hypothetical protein KXV85_001506, partial [Aspergillus fumigatus]